MTVGRRGNRHAPVGARLLRPGQFHSIETAQGDQAQRLEWLALRQNRSMKIMGDRDRLFRALRIVQAVSEHTIEQDRMKEGGLKISIDMYD
jgi:hypothetical protein